MNCFEEIREKAKVIYGHELPRQVKERLDWEIDCLRNYHNTAELEYSYKITSQANCDHQTFGNRGTIASLLSAYLLGITNINPLKAHYYCDECKYSAFEGYENYYTCLDLPNKTCPKCGKQLKRSGYNIPAESSFGYEGSKQIRVQLAFSKDYVNNIDFLDSCKELLINVISTSEITKLQNLKEVTGVELDDIKFDDSKVLELLLSSDTNGITEFETEFIRNMIDVTAPKSLSNLIKIIGLCHGTNTWNNNADYLIGNGIAVIDEVPALREDVFEYLLSKGVSRIESFRIAIATRKGKFVPSESDIELLQSHDVPMWYIESLSKIKYMFPKSHAVSKFIQSYQLAWFKVYYPKVFEEVVAQTSSEF